LAKLVRFVAVTIGVGKIVGVLDQIPQLMEANGVLRLP